LTVHEKRTGVKLRVREAQKEPIVEELLVPEFDRKELGKGWGKEGKWVVDEVTTYEQERLKCIKEDLEEKK
jgi:glycyl-tRNA synthetase